MKKTLLLSGAACLLALNVQASNFLPYVGIDYNYALVNHDAQTDGIMSGHANSATLSVGSKIAPFMGVEAFYGLSKKEHKTNYRTQIQSYGADILGYLPFGCYDEFELIGAAGAGWYTAKFDKDQDSGWGYRLGAGLQYNISDHWSARVMYRHVWIDKNVIDDLDEFSIGVRYHF